MPLGHSWAPIANGASASDGHGMVECREPDRVEIAQLPQREHDARVEKAGCQPPVDGFERDAA